MKVWPFLLFFLVGCAPLFSVQAPPGWKTAQYDYYSYEDDDRNVQYVPDYKLGDQRVHASTIDYSCETSSGRTYTIPNPGKDCYSAFLSSSFTDNSRYKSGDVKNINQYLSIRADFSGGYDTKQPSKSDWKEIWTFMFSPDAIKLYPVSQDFNYVLGEGKILVDVENNLPASMNGGVNVIITERKFFKQEDKNYPLTLAKGRNRYELPIRFETLGTIQVDLQPYIIVYDTSVLTTEDTGICFIPQRHGSKQCYQKKILAFDPHVQYKYGSFPVGTDLKKDVTTDCKINADCPTTFSCQSNICTRTKGVSSETLLEEAFIKQPRSDLLPAIIAISLIMIVVLVVTRGK